MQSLLYHVRLLRRITSLSPCSSLEAKGVLPEKWFVATLYNYQTEEFLYSSELLELAYYHTENRRETNWEEGSMGVCNILPGMEIHKDTCKSLSVASGLFEQWTLRNWTFPRSLTLGEEKAEAWSWSEENKKYWNQESVSGMDETISGQDCLVTHTSWLLFKPKLHYYTSGPSWWAWSRRHWTSFFIPWMWSCWWHLALFFTIRCLLTEVLIMGSLTWQGHWVSVSNPPNMATEV